MVLLEAWQQGIARGEKRGINLSQIETTEIKNGDSPHMAPMYSQEDAQHGIYEGLTVGNCK